MFAQAITANLNGFPSSRFLRQFLNINMDVEKISSRKEERAELEHAMKAAINGDLYVVYKQNQLARSTKKLFKLT